MFENAQKPVKISLGTHLKPQGRGAKRRLVEKNDWMVYIPLLKTLSVLLNRATILSEVQHNIIHVAESIGTRVL